MRRPRPPLVLQEGEPGIVGIATALAVAVCALATAVGFTAQAHAASAGSLDRSFGHDGRVLTDLFGHDDEANAVAIQDDGRIVVAGKAGIDHARHQHGGQRMAIARYRRDGRLDRSFAADGKRVVRRWEATGGSGATALAIQRDGRILAAGPGLVRFRENGKLDRSFGDMGLLRRTLVSPRDIALQPDGKIVLAGDAYVGGEQCLGVARLQHDGTPDPDFGSGGLVATRCGRGYDFAYAVALQTDGRIVVAGEDGCGWLVARFLANGAPDPSFGEGGAECSDPVLSFEARDVAIQPDNKIVVGGTDIGDAGATFALGRYLPDGSFDPTFADGGAQHTTFQDSYPGDYGTSLALQPDGKLLLAGTAFVRHGGPYEGRFALARYMPNGSLDPTFARDGKAVTNLRPNYPYPRHFDIGTAVALQANGRIVMAGFSPEYGGEDFALVRYLGSPSR
jgi:uncharacterized delta-60 repeat protein